jgi:hypothetical protein
VADTLFSAAIDLATGSRSPLMEPR